MKKETYFYDYTVKYWDELTDDWATATGVTIGKDFVEAMDHLQEYYGGDAINNIKITTTDEQYVYSIKEDYGNV